MNDENAKHQAMQFISQYRRMTGASLKQALQFGATDDVGPIVWHGIDILRKEYGMPPLRERNPDT